MKEIALDVLVLWVAVIIGTFGVYIDAPVLVLIGVIFVTASIVWLIMDLWAGVKGGHK